MVAIATLALALAGFSGVAHAADPEPEGSSGSTFVDGQVTCGTHNTFIDDPITIHNGDQGLEVCSDELPVQGRVFIWHQPGSTFFRLEFLHIDGDADNPAPLPQGHVLHIPIGIP
jgi:hypothetical protein